MLASMLHHRPGHKVILYAFDVMILGVLSEYALEQPLRCDSCEDTKFIRWPIHCP